MPYQNSDIEYKYPPEYTVKGFGGIMGFRNFMDGRYGVDDLGRFLMFATLGMLVLSFFISNMFIMIIAGALLAYNYFRMFSRNVTRRYEENQKFLSFWRGIASFFKIGFMRIKDREHRYFRCPRCRRTLRVPRGKGRISIHCPTCGTDFVKKT